MSVKTGFAFEVISLTDDGHPRIFEHLKWLRAGDIFRRLGWTLLLMLMLMTLMARDAGTDGVVGANTRRPGDVAAIPGGPSRSRPRSRSAAGVQGRPRRHRVEAGRPQLMAGTHAAVQPPPRLLLLLLQMRMLLEEGSVRPVSMAMMMMTRLVMISVFVVVEPRRRVQRLRRRPQSPQLMRLGMRRRRRLMTVVMNGWRHLVSVNTGLQAGVELRPEVASSNHPVTVSPWPRDSIGAYVT